MRPARWAGTHDEEARAYLQVRLTLFTKLMFTAIVTLMAFLFVMYAAYPIAPRHNDLIFGGASVELAVMAFLWRGLLVRRTLSVQALYRIDLFTGDEKERDRTYYARFRWLLGRGLDLDTDYQYEKDSNTEYHTLIVGLRKWF